MRFRCLIIFTLMCSYSVLAKQPNIVFLFSDDHATQAIGAYGHKIAKLAPTPSVTRYKFEIFIKDLNLLSITHHAGKIADWKPLLLAKVSLE